MATLKWYRGLHWGRRKENGVWLRRRPAGNGYGRLRYRVWINTRDTALYAQAGYLHMRIMKPGRA
jgi:hypothetical protein